MVPVVVRCKILVLEVEVKLLYYIIYFIIDIKRHVSISIVDVI